MTASLASIRVLFRAPDTLVLFGIPYEMRPGQQPGDLWRANHDYVPPRPGWYGSKQTSLADWVYLGSPGWYAGLSDARVDEIRAFLATCGDLVPDGPYEWATLPAK